MILHSYGTTVAAPQNPAAGEHIGPGRPESAPGGADRSTHRWTVTLLRNPADLSSLQDEWNRLAERFETPLLRYEWFEAAAAVLPAAALLSVIALRRDGELAGLAPLAVTRRGGLERTELIGSSLLGEPCGLICRDAESRLRLLEAICSTGATIFLGRIPAEHLDPSLVRRVARSQGLVSFHGSSQSQWLPIGASWSGFEESLSARRRSDLRRARRRAESIGRVEFEFVSPTPATVGRYLPEIFRVEATGWKERRGTSMRSNSELRRFFTLYSCSAARSGILRLAFMRINGEAVAAQLAVEYAGSCWILKIGYNESFRRCSPGIVLMHEMIRHSFERRLKGFEFLGDLEPWIGIWTDRVHSYNTYRIYPPTPAGLWNLGHDGMLHAAERILRGRRGG